MVRSFKHFGNMSAMQFSCPWHPLIPPCIVIPPISASLNAQAVDRTGRQAGHVIRQAKPVDNQFVLLSCCAALASSIDILLARSLLFVAMMGRDFVDSSPSASEAGSTCDENQKAYATASSKKRPRRKAAEPSASDTSAPSRPRRIVVPLEQPYRLAPTQLQVKRPRVDWVEKTSERLYEAHADFRERYGVGDRPWAAAASGYDRAEPSAGVVPEATIVGSEELSTVLARKVASELGAAKQSLAITDPAFHPERFTMIIMGRPVQVPFVLQPMLAEPSADQLCCSLYCSQDLLGHWLHPT